MPPTIRRKGGTETTDCKLLPFASFLSGNMFLFDLGNVVFHENEAKKIIFLEKKIQDDRFFKMAVFQNR